jgi:ABC-type Fe3+ transport system permease subunit
MALPPFLLALGWFGVFGRQGLLGSEATSALLFGSAGVAAILSLAFTPVVTSLVAVALLGVDPAQEEAARIMARPLRVVTRILLPAVRPALVLAAILVFTLTLSELDAVLIVEGGMTGGGGMTRATSHRASFDAALSRFVSTRHQRFD